MTTRGQIRGCLKNATRHKSWRSAFLAGFIVRCWLFPSWKWHQNIKCLQTQKSVQEAVIKFSSLSVCVCTCPTITRHHELQEDCALRHHGDKCTQRLTTLFLEQCEELHSFSFSYSPALLSVLFANCFTTNTHQRDHGRSVRSVKWWVHRSCYLHVRCICHGQNRSKWHQSYEFQKHSRMLIVVMATII